MSERADASLLEVGATDWRAAAIAAGEAGIEGVSLPAFGSVGVTSDCAPCQAASILATVGGDSRSAGTAGAVLASAGAGTEPRDRGGAKKSARLGRPVSFGEEASPSCVFLESDPLMALSVLPCVLMGCPTTGRP
jgi:hypothetical protein